MEDKRNLHLKVQELIDCHAGTDPLKGMSEIGQETDRQEAALKWLALATLHAITDGAEKISLRVDDQGQVRVTADYREKELPPLDAELAREIVKSVRSIAHIEGDKGKTPLALGVRNDSVQVGVKLKDKGGVSKLSLKF